ncbi:MAG TPA: LD-carboxypeptidase [Clostridiaceae bacterium]|nr:LD-carboxypeptidase [Clostridiaceae bacterium]
MMTKRLRIGDEIRVIAPSGSLSQVRPEVSERALRQLREYGFMVSFSTHSGEIDEFHTSSVKSRVEDLHEAFLDPRVKAIFTCAGGFHVNQILPYLDYSLLARQPKILCGFSDITALLNAIHAKTGMITYHGPHFSTFAYDEGRDYTWKMFSQAVMREEPYILTPHAEESYHCVQEGIGEGELIGGNLCTLNLLQGTPYMPELSGKIIFLEDDNIMGDYFLAEFDRNLQSLLQVPGADSIRGIIFGRFEESTRLDQTMIRKIVRGKVKTDIPIVFGVDFGHLRPTITLPIGGRALLEARAGEVRIEILSH